MADLPIETNLNDMYNAPLLSSISGKPMLPNTLHRASDSGSFWLWGSDKGLATTLASYYFRILETFRRSVLLNSGIKVDKEDLLQEPSQLFRNTFLLGFWCQRTGHFVSLERYTVHTLTCRGSIRDLHPDLIQKWNTKHIENSIFRHGQRQNERHVAVFQLLGCR